MMQDSNWNSQGRTRRRRQRHLFSAPPLTTTEDTNSSSASPRPIVLLRGWVSTTVFAPLLLFLVVTGGPSISVWGLASFSSTRAFANCDGGRGSRCSLVTHTVAGGEGEEFLFGASRTFQQRHSHRDCFSGRSSEMTALGATRPSVEEEVATSSASSRFPYETVTEDMEREALASLVKGSDDTARHIYGHGDPGHQLSMLQRVTATRVMDYEKMLSDPSSPTPEDLLARIKETEERLGPRLNLAEVIQSRSPSMALAAEFKRSSPSKGNIAAHLNAGEQAAKYARGGANVISVLTEYHWFQGTLDDLAEVRISAQREAEEMGREARPAILRKEFTTNTYQILEAAAYGGDTILLIVAVLPSDLLKELIDFARGIGMEPLVEVHGDLELDVALEAGAKVIGVNNRNLHTFQMDLATTDRTAEELTDRKLFFDHSSIAATTEDGSPAALPPYTLCSLSGMSNAEDVQRYRELGVGMCLIGESLMRAADPEKAIRGLCLDPKDYNALASSLAGGAYTGGTKIVKVCGVTNPDDALVACRSGASLIGVIFAAKSKRKVTAEEARLIVEAVRQFGERGNRVDVLGRFAERESGEGGGADSIRSLVRKTRALETACRRPLVVGVFQNSPLDEVRAIAEDVGLDLVQLHGDEGMEACSMCGVPAVRVVHMELEEDGEGTASADERASKIIDSLTSDPIAILLDTAVKGVQGGSGVTFDWDVAKALQDRGLPVLVAGGLTDDNVSEVVTDVRPWGVDVSSGVEESPGKKDGRKVEAFVVGARAAAVEASKGF